MIMSRLLQDGKKSLARRLFYESMEHVERLASAKSGPEKAGALPKGEAEGVGKAEFANLERASSAKSTDSDLAGKAGSTTSSLRIFQQAVLNVTPVVEVKSRRVGGANFQVPLEVNSERGTALALRWIVQAARQRPGREMASKLANEFIDASNKTGNAIRKREETHRMAEANKAFANYRF
jgi:ribosomal protein S7